MNRYVIFLLLGISSCFAAGCLDLGTTDSSTSGGGGMGGPACGDGHIDPGEVCDDGNLLSGDACSATCSMLGLSSPVVGSLNNPGSTDGIGTEARLSNATIMALHGDTLFLADSLTVRTLDIATAAVTTIAGAAQQTGNMDAPQGLDARFSLLTAIATDGSTVWVADGPNYLLRSVSLTAPYKVTTVAGTGMAGVKDGVGVNAGIEVIRGMTYLNGIVYMVDTGADVLRSFDPQTGEIKTLAGIPYQGGYADGNGLEAQFIEPRNVISDGVGMLYIADMNGSSIRTYDIAKQQVNTLVRSASCGYVDGWGADVLIGLPRGMAFDGKSLFWGETEAYTIRQFVLATHVVTTLSGTADPCFKDCGCVGDTFQQYVEGVGAKAMWNRPHDLVYHAASKSLFVADNGHNMIRRIQ